MLFILFFIYIIQHYLSSLEIFYNKITDTFIIFQSFILYVCYIKIFKYRITKHICYFILLFIFIINY